MAYRAPFIDSTGIHISTYADTLAYFQQQFRNIYGSDIVLDPSSQDGQLVAIYARAIFDNGQALQAAYNQFSPSTAQGTALSSQVKINGIARLIATASTADVVITGTPATQIVSGVVQDTGNTLLWSLPAMVVIPASGTITVTATCQTLGAIAASANTLTIIFTPINGWAGVTNPTAATMGNPIESDAALRVRQTTSTAQPSQSILDGLRGALLALNGVTSAVVYENPTDVTDTNVPPRAPHSISCVVAGGDINQIANAIWNRKTLGTNSLGWPSVITGRITINIYPYGVQPTPITFWRPTQVAVNVNISLKALVGWVGTTTAPIITAVQAFINALLIGQEVYRTRVVSASYNTVALNTYDIIGLTLSAAGKTPDANGDIFFNDNEQAIAGAVTISVS